MPKRKCPECKEEWLVLTEKIRGSLELVWWCMWCGYTEDMIRKEVTNEIS